MYRKKYSRVLPVAVALMTLAACGGDGDDQLGDNIPPPGMNPPPPPPPPVLGDTTAVIGNSVVTFNRATPGTLVTTQTVQVNAGETIVGGDYRPADGKYYVVTSASAVYAVDPATGAVSGRVPLALTAGGTPVALDATAGAAFGIDFNPVPDRLRITSSGGQNLRVNVVDGSTTVDGNLTLASASIGASEVGYTNNFANTCRTTLFYIDTAGDRLLTTTNPNGGVVTAVGAGLGVDASGAAGFEIISTSSGSAITNTAIVALTVGSTTSLYSLNLSTGVVSAAQAIGAGNAPVVGLSVTPATTGPANALGDFVAVTTTNNLISFNAAAPTKLCTTAPITAAAGTTLAANEVLLDLDVRPKDGLVYAVSSASKVYTVDTSPTGMGAVTLKSTLSAAVDPAATAVGIDFNPTVDRLRIVANTGQNLRVNVDSGAVTTDLAINGQPNASVTAVAYTNSINGATTTRLLDIDVANDTLALQNPPNNGVLANPVSLGTMGAPIDVATASGFDINGLTNAGFAAFSLTGGTAGAPSRLYTITLNPAMGVPVAALATTPAAGNNIGGPTAPPIRGFALTNLVNQASNATVVAITGTNALFTFNAMTPGTPLAPPVQISGLTGETIVGMDLRIANRAIYAVSASGKLFTINLTIAAPVAPALFGTVTAAAAVPVGTAGTLVAGGTPAFAGLAGVNFGVDVNPVVDRLRVVSDAQQNLRIVMDANAGGAVDTLVDTALTLATSVTDVAYTGNIAGTPFGTTLFGLDTGATSLVSFATPNNGVATTVGPLTNATMPLPAGAVAPGTTFTGIGAFDFFGPDNSSVVILQTTGETQSRLYTVNTTTGALTAFPVPATGPNLVGPTDTVVTAATTIVQ